MSAEDDDDHEATLARKCAKAFRVLAEMSHKGGAEAQVVERAGNDLERWLLGLNEVLANTYLSPSLSLPSHSSISLFNLSVASLRVQAVHRDLCSQVYD